ncbi:MAG TPA: alkyl hydroperoxide reductase [Dehalococcoidia bacterium]
MHTLPQLRELERRYPSELAVVGVHAGKFWNERRTEGIRKAVQRLGLTHPVVNDRYFRIWRAYDVNAWPTVVLIDPEGRYVGSQPGEITADLFDPIIGGVVAEFQRRGTLDRRPLPFRPEPEPAGPLAFPQKVLAAGGRLFVADTNHHRVLLARLSEDGGTARVEAVAGGGEGFRDGPLETAAFRHPHGLSLAGDVLYVADTGNHAVRAVDLAAGTVRTVAGTGELARGLMAPGLGPEVALRSPWDVLAVDGAVYIAMAGSHQIWRYDPQDGWLEPFAGSGWEDIVDGTRLEAALAQPSGLAAAGGRLFFADSEASGVRWTELRADGDVHTVVGRGLFEFGDTDGRGDEVRLQHPLGVAWLDGRLYVADTYNHKVKVIDPDARTAATFLGTGEAGLRDGEAPQFDEPGGLSAAEGRLYVADTNNHAVRVVDAGTRTVRTVAFTGL